MQNLLSYLWPFFIRYLLTSAKMLPKSFTCGTWPHYWNTRYSNIQCKSVEDDGWPLRYDLPQLAVAIIFAVAVAIFAATTPLPPPLLLPSPQQFLWLLLSVDCYMCPPHCCRRCCHCHCCCHHHRHCNCSLLSMWLLPPLLAPLLLPPPLSLLLCCCCCCCHCCCLHHRPPLLPLLPPCCYHSQCCNPFQFHCQHDHSLFSCSGRN